MLARCIVENIPGYLTKINLIRIGSRSNIGGIVGIGSVGSGGSGGAGYAFWAYKCTYIIDITRE